MTNDPRTGEEALPELLEEAMLDDGACVTAVPGADEAEVVRRFGGDPGGARSGRLGEELWDESMASERDLIAVSTVDGVVVVVEYGGFQGVREEVLRPLSRLGGGRAASAYWGEDAMSELALAEGGFVLSSFEMPFPGRRSGKRPGAWDPYLEGIDLGAGERWTGGVTAVARATGARLDAAWAAGPHRVVAVDEVPGAVLPQALEDSPLLSEEPFARYRARLGPGVTAAMERDAVELAAAHLGVAREPLCTLALAVLDGCGPPEGREGLRAELAAAQAADRAARAACAGGRAEVWQVLGDLLAREAAGAGPGAGPPPMFLLARAMKDGGDTEESRRFWLLHALHHSARRAAGPLTPG